MSIRLASSFPKLHFIVQDLASTVDSAASSLPPELSDRVEFMPHDFFTEQPVKGADLYLFRWIFHNWLDDYCIKILHSLIPALKKGAMIVINDNVLPEPGTMGLWQERRLRYVTARILIRSCNVYFLSTFLPGFMLDPMLHAVMSWIRQSLTKSQ